MKKTLFLFVLALASTFSEACSCLDQPRDLFSTTSDYTQEYLVVFDSYQEIPEQVIGGMIITSPGDIGVFKIITSINDKDGNVTGDMIEVRGGNEALCQQGVRFNKNDTLIISVNKSPEYYLSICRQSYIKIQNGEYTGIPTNEIVDKLKKTITYVKEENSNNLVSIFPNPVNDKLFIESASSTIKNIEILNLDGVSFLSYPTTTTGFSSISLDKLNSGLYIVKITTENGLITKTISKQ